LFLLVLSVLFLPAWVRAQETASRVPTLTFYSHPTERYNILIPPGWENVSTDDARLINTALGAQLDAFALRGDVEARLSEWAREAIGAPEIELIHTSTVRLTTGEWTQRLYRLPGSGMSALTVFSQAVDGVNYILAFSTQQPVYAFVVPLEEGLVDADDAERAIAAGLAALGLDAERLSPAEAVDSFYEQALLVGDTPYTALAQRSGELTADVIIGPASAAASEDAVMLTIVRDFFLTPDTTNYLLLGLAASFLILGGMVVSLIIRRQNLLRDEKALRQVLD
jgi:hypothetical protein